MTELSNYQQNHLRVAFMESAPLIYRPMIEASLAHVIMLGEQGLLPEARVKVLLEGLRTLWEERATTFVFDGGAEDVYYHLERELARVLEVAPTELDVQLARSRNDLDAGVFRMVLREQTLEHLSLIGELLALVSDRAAEFADFVIIGYTHRRPAQPTTAGHVLAGYGEALISQADELRSVLDELDVSPFGSCAFAGTDLPIDPRRIGDLLGFRSEFESSYEAVAGAEHLMRVAAVQARILATGARLSRVLLEWMTHRWITTPKSFSQGSSIMPQKQNPVVLEHLCSMAGAAAGDLATVMNDVGLSWYEDSNNATTDVQYPLWRSSDRTTRFLRLMCGVLGEIAPGVPPSAHDLVVSGVTTTAAAEALAQAGVPWRGAHEITGRLVSETPPHEWSDSLLDDAARASGFTLSPDARQSMLRAALDPHRVLERSQAGGPGRDAVLSASRRLVERAGAVRGEAADVVRSLELARERLFGEVAAALR